MKHEEFHAFSNKKFDDYSEKKREEAIKAFGCEIAENANDLTSGELKGFIEEKMGEYFDKYYVKEVKIKEKEIKKEESEKDIIIYVPYDGNVEMLRLKPSVSSDETLKVFLNEKEIGVKVKDLASKTKEEISEGTDKIVEELKKNLDSLKKDIEECNKELKKGLKDEAEKIKKRIEKDKEKLKEIKEIIKK
ncbi:hypothetical protein DW261_05050 [Fusobacterium varium]|uniref:hypothetical protein n=1 Tax=Fusobacterium varium TaxID=856 RepID=UPI000E5238A6|nr:hypothetical protein [Fusobacterium varium]RHG36594.1 hypothetical protein DW261_05050 [Fusobacterium varium]